MYLEYQNIVALGFFLFFALIGVTKNKDYKFAVVVSLLGVGTLFVPTQLFIDYTNFIWPSR